MIADADIATFAAAKRLRRRLHRELRTWFAGVAAAALSLAALTVVLGAIAVYVEIATTAQVRGIVARTAPFAAVLAGLGIIVAVVRALAGAGPVNSYLADRNADRAGLAACILLAVTIVAAAARGMAGEAPLLDLIGVSNDRRP